MRVIDWSRRNDVELAWAVFAVLNFAAMVVWPAWETIPFHIVWITLTIVYGFRVWSQPTTTAVLVVVSLAMTASIMVDAFAGVQLWGELTEVPLMATMFIAMVWHARRRLQAMEETEEIFAVQKTLLERQERFLHDASHELRTPVTIARGHLELLRWTHPESHELEIAVDELDRIERIVGRLLLLAKAGRPDFVVPDSIDVESFLEDVFMRWSEVAPRVWRLGTLAQGTLRADYEGLRTALDALLENAVKYTRDAEWIELRAMAEPGGTLAIEVADGGRGVEPDAVERIFERFGRADTARTRSDGGVGLGLAIVDAIARGHGGACTVTTSGDGAIFALRLPGFAPRAATQTAHAAPAEERLGAAVAAPSLNPAS